MSLTRRRLLTTTAAATSALSLPASLTKAMADAAPDCGCTRSTRSSTS